MFRVSDITRGRVILSSVNTAHERPLTHVLSPTGELVEYFDTHEHDAIISYVIYIYVQNIHNTADVKALTSGPQAHFFLSCFLSVVMKKNIRVTVIFYIFLIKNDFVTNNVFFMTTDKKQQHYPLCFLRTTDKNRQCYPLCFINNHQ